MTVSQSLVCVSVGHKILIVGMKIKLGDTTQWNKPPQTLSQTYWRGQHQCLQHHNSSCARERVRTFSVSLQNFVSSCSSQTVSHSSFSNPSVSLPTSQFIVQPFCCFTYITAHSATLLSLLLRHRLFTYITWRAAHVIMELQ